MKRFVASALLLTTAWMIVKARPADTAGSATPGLEVAVPVSGKAITQSPQPEKAGSAPAIPVAASASDGVVPQEFHSLTGAVLLPQAQKEKLEKLLADESIQARVLSALSALPASDDEATVAARLEAIDYVARAIEWERNPARAALIQRMEAGLTEVSGKLQGEWAGRTAALRKVVVADQVELLGLLYGADPEAYARYRNRVKQDSWLERITQYARNVRQNNGGHP
jgi:hypothetical protein